MTSPTCFITDHDLLVQLLDDALEADVTWCYDALTPLHMAVSRNDLESVDIMLDHIAKNVVEYR